MPAHSAFRAVAPAAASAAFAAAGVADRKEKGKPYYYRQNYYENIIQRFHAMHLGLAACFKADTLFRNRRFKSDKQTSDLKDYKSRDVSDEALHHDDAERCPERFEFLADCGNRRNARSV